MWKVVVIVDPYVSSDLFSLQQSFHIIRSGLVLRITSLYSKVWPLCVVRSSLQAGGSSKTGGLGN